MADIFIGYARHNRATVEMLAATVEAAGYSVWWDRQIVGGSEFSRDIERELNAARAVIIVWSKTANESPWVKDEAGVARDQAKLVPVSLDQEQPPLGFRQYQAIDFSRWKGQPDSVEVQHLIRAIEARLSGAEPEIVTATQGPTLPRRKKRLPIAIALAVILLAIIGFTAFNVSNNASGPKSRNQQTGIDPSPATTAPVVAESLPRLQVSAIRVREENPELQNLAAVLTEDIASGLSRFSYFQVITDKQGKTDDRVGPRYELQGTLRLSGSTLRLTTQLKDNQNGKQVWGETFDRQYDAASILAIQDDLTDHVVASAADPYGALMRDLASGVGLITVQDMTPYQAVLRHFVYRQRISSDDHLATRNALERAVIEAPGDANVWAALAGIYTEEYKHSYNVLPDSLERALNAARKAVELEPDNAYAHFILSEVHFFRQEVGAFRASADRAIELNPRDSDAMAMIGILLGYSGDWVRSAERTKRAMELNPNHPGWYSFNLFFNAYRLGDYETALQIAEQINMPDYFADSYSRAIAHAQLGHTAEATKALQQFLSQWPDFSHESFIHDHLGKWFYAQPELTEQIIDGMNKAGWEEN